MLFILMITLLQPGTTLDLNEISEMMKMMDLKKFLGGDIKVDAWFPLMKYPSPFGQFKLTYPTDLICDSFDALGTVPCRWRNEWTICGSGDELDFVRACGQWGDEQADTIFNTKIRPVSDPIQCQHGDSTVVFNYWTSPRVRIRVCVRKPGAGKIYDWCSEAVNKKSPGPANVIIPGSIMCTFEIVIEAYNFVLDNFGQQGGIAVVDSIAFYATAIYNCQLVPHFEPLPPLNEDTCKRLVCDFDQYNCLTKEKEMEEESDFRVTGDAIGSYHAGIRTPLKGDFAYARGPSSVSLEMGPLNITRTLYFEFCYYRSTVYSKLSVNLYADSGKETKLFVSPESYVVHSWICERIPLPMEQYESLSFNFHRMKSVYSMVGLDEINVIDPSTGQSCINAIVFHPPKNVKTSLTNSNNLNETILRDSKQTTNNQIDYLYDTADSL